MKTVAKRDYAYSNGIVRKCNRFTIGKVGDDETGALYLDKEKWPYHSVHVVITALSPEESQEDVTGDEREEKQDE